MVKIVHPTCRRESRYANLTELGWDRIVAPEVYDLGVCVGTCENSNGFYIIQELLGGEGSKCGPIKFSPISVLYINEKWEVVLNKYSDMVVEECGCV